MARLLLHVAFINLGGGREACAQRMVRKLLAALGLGKIPAHAGGQGRALGQAAPPPDRSAVRLSPFALTCDAAEEGAMRDTGQLQLGLQGDGQVASDEPSPISTSASRSCPAT